MPTKSVSSKVSATNPDAVHININPSLSSVGAAETFSHEGYGHATIYVETGGNRERAIHQPTNNRETNIELVQKINNARKETINNMGL